MLFYIAEVVLGFFGVHFTSVNGSGIVGIGFSVVVVIVAALNLVLDFDFIESGVRANAPKYMEWIGGFRADGHADLALSGDSDPAVEDSQSRLKGTIRQGL